MTDHPLESVVCIRVLNGGHNSYFFFQLAAHFDDRHSAISFPMRNERKKGRNHFSTTLNIQNERDNIFQRFPLSCIRWLRIINLRNLNCFFFRFNRVRNFILCLFHLIIVKQQILISLRSPRRFPSLLSSFFFLNIETVAP